MTSPLGQAALAYAGHGLAVFPLKPRSKQPQPGTHGVHDATRDAAVIEAWWEAEPDANIGIACGKPSGVVVFDVDGEVGAESLAALNLALPLTPVVSTGKGTHIYFRMPDQPLGNRAGMSPGLDFRADGGYVVAPPSVHPDGRLYEWSVNYTVPFAAIPAEILEMAQRSVSVSQTLEGPIPKGKRNDTAFRQASAMRRLGMDEDAIFTALRADRRYEPPLSDFELKRVSKNAARYEPDKTLDADEAFKQRTVAKTRSKTPDLQAQAVAEADPDYIPGIEMSEVQPERVSWLWRPYFPVGKLVILDGDPGLGKSTLLLDLMARWSRGMANPDGSVSEQMPDDGFGGVVISVEDGLSDTVQPRLVAQKADLNKIRAIVEIRRQGVELSVTIPNDIPLIKRAIELKRARFMIIDPLMAVLSPDVDAHKDQDVRAKALGPLKQLAEETGCTIALIRHFNKMTGPSAVQRGGGSIGIVGATRSAMIVAKDPASPEESRVFAHAKINLAKMGKSWRYHIEDMGDIGHLIWDEICDLTADQLVMQDLRDAPKKAEAIQFIKDMLSSGAMQVVDLKKHAEAQGLSWRTVEDNRKLAGAKAYRDGYQGPMVWALQGDQPDEEVDV